MSQKHIVVTEDPYCVNPDYSNLLRNQAIDPDWEAWSKILSDSLQISDNIAEYGAGFGNLAIPIANLGYHYTAYDLNCDAIEHINSQGILNLKGIIEDVQHAQGNDVYSCIIIRSCLLNVMKEDVRSRTISNAFKQLQKGGILFLEIFNEPWLKAEESFSNEYQSVFVNLNIGSESIFTVRVLHKIKDILYDHIELVHALTPRDIDALVLEKGGIVQESFCRSPLTDVYKIMKV
jgi:2-polyprenyl-3-methyl-5-hydroxy-6-metoxy-1,4-benzoquinol methylase